VSTLWLIVFTPRSEFGNRARPGDPERGDVVGTSPERAHDPRDRRQGRIGSHDLVVARGTTKDHQREGGQDGLVFSDGKWRRFQGSRRVKRKESLLLTVTEQA